MSKIYLAQTILSIKCFKVKACIDGDDIVVFHPSGTELFEYGLGYLS